MLPPLFRSDKGSIEGVFIFIWPKSRMVTSNASSTGVIGTPVPDR